MSASYVAIGWNRQKRIYDWFILLFCVIYLVVFITTTVLVNPDYTFETVLIRSTSTLAMLLLHIILCIGPFARINSKFLPLLYNRRHLGVTMFLVALVHGGFSILQFHSLGNANPFVSLLESNTQYNSLPGFPFQALGLAALIILALMAATSHDFWLHNLSPKVWKGLHMMVYLAYFLIVMHIMLGSVEYETSPVLLILLAIGVATVVTLHIIAGLREVKNDNMSYPTINQGFVRVCKVGDIEDSRAKMFCINIERIAVFKTGNKLFAVNNVCKHQNGPLGDGKIVDGCITCPWHGYQYLPHNGQSPPPFKEQVSTYDVMVNEGYVWVNPVAYPEGTERPGAVINL